MHVLNLQPSVLIPIYQLKAFYWAERGIMPLPLCQPVVLRANWKALPFDIFLNKQAQYPPTLLGQISNRLGKKKNISDIYRHVCVNTFYRWYHRFSDGNNKGRPFSTVSPKSRRQWQSIPVTMSHLRSLEEPNEVAFPPAEQQPRIPYKSYEIVLAK